ncbi:MAG: autotransporter-associated beta strand repeat-containing protein [Verrucomicrobiota bacterium]
MKSPFIFRFIQANSLLAALAVMLAAQVSDAATLTWDGSDVVTTGAQGGTGIWNTNTTFNWWNTSDVVWPVPGGVNDVAIFGGTAGTVTVTSVIANGLTFNTTGYTLASGTLTLNGSTPTISSGTGIATTISSVIAGSSGLAKTGAGTLTLSGSNTYSGATTIAPLGTLSISSDANLGTAPATATPGSLLIDSTATLATTASFTLNSNRGMVIGPSTGIGSGIIDVLTGTILSYGGIITSNGSGTGGLTKMGAGTLVLSGSNLYTGDTAIAVGTLRLGSGTVIPYGLGKGNVAVSGILDLYGNSASINGLSGAGTVTSGAAGSVTLSVGGNNQTSTFSGAIQNGSGGGTLALTKTGSGTLTLSGTNTFTGGVTINGGVLQLASAGALNSASPNSLLFGPSAAVGTKLQLNGNNLTVSSLATDATPGTVVVEDANAAAATLTINQTSSTIFAGVLQNGTGGGTLSLTKSGAGILTLSGTNSYTGTTTISAGTLALSNGSAIADTGAVVLANTAGATLLLNASETIGSLAGGGASGGNVTLQGFTLTTGGANSSTTYSGVISGAGSLVKTGSGGFTLANGNSFTGTTTIKSGSIILGVLNALPTATALTLGDGSTHANGSLKLNGFSQTLAGLTTAGAGTTNSVVNGSATAVSLTLNIAVSSSFGGILGGGGTYENNFNLLKTGVGTLTLSGSNTFSGTTTISQGTLSAINLTNALGTGASAVILGDASNTGWLAYTGSSATFSRGFTVNAGGGEIDTTTAGQTLTLSTGNVAASGALTLGGSGNISITSNITGTGSLNKTGTGTLTLSGSNTYSGATNLKNGTLVLAVNDTGLKSTTTLTLGDATLNTNGVLKLDGHTQTLAGLSVAGSGTGNHLIGGNNALSTLTLNIGASNTFAGILGGSGTNENNLALIKTGSGTLTLSGANTHTGGTTVSAGILSISLDSNLGGTSGGVVLNGGTLSANSSFTIGSRSIVLGPTSGSGSGTLDVLTGNTLTYGGVLANNGSGIGSLIKTSPGTLILSGASSYSGSTSILDGSLSLGVSNALPIGTSLTLGASTTGGILKLNGKSQELAGLAAFGGGTNRIVNGNLTISTLTLNIASSATYTAYFGGSGTNENNFNLTKTGIGTLTISGANTYAGNTTVSAGTLKIGSSVTIPSGSGKGNLVLDGTLDLSTYGITINGLSGAGSVTTSALSAVNLTVGSNDQSSTFSGVIQSGNGTLSLIKTGAGTLTLTGANTYTGLTTVYAGGTLKIGNAAAIPSGIGKGNVSLSGSLDLNGYTSITLNGLSGNGGISSSAAGGNLTLFLGANDQTSSYGGAITNGSATSLALTKVGAGTLSLSSVGTNSYTGGTNISAGTLLLANDRTLPSAGSVFVDASGTLDVYGRSGANAAMGRLTGSGIVTNSSASTGTLTVGNGDVSSTFYGSLQDGTGLLILSKSGLGTFTLTPATNNAFSGGVSISGGIIQIGNANALNSAGSNVVSFSNIISGTTPKLQLNGNSITIAGLSTTSASPVVENASASAATLTINNSANYSYVGLIQDAAGGGALSLIKSNSGTQTLTAINTYTGGTTITGGILAINKDAALGATSGLLTIGAGKLEATASIGSSSRNIALTNSAATIVVDTGFTYTEAGIISGSGTLNKEGKGIFQISGIANTYNGGTVITAGLLDVLATSGTPLGSQLLTDTNNNVNVNPGGNLSLSSTNNKGAKQTITVTSSSSALGGIGFSNTSLTQALLSGMFTDNSGGYGGVLSINNGINYTGSINLGSFGSGNWYLGSAASGPLSGALTIGSGNTYRLGGGGGTLSITGTNALTGTGDLLVGSSFTNGNGSVIVNVAQNFTGKTTVTGGGILSIGLDTSLGTAPGSVTPGKLVLDNGTLQARAAITLSATRGIAIGPSSGTGSGTFDTNGNNVSYGGIIANNGSGTGSLTKMGTGALTLTGTNTYTGATNINGGTINFTTLANLGAGTAINFNGGTLQYASSSTIDITTRTVTLGSSGGMIDTGGNNITFANALAGGGSFSKTGNGTLTLSAVNSMGNITVNVGTLQLGVAGATPATSNLILNSNAIFDIHGFDATVANLSSNSALAMVINSAAGTKNTLTVSSNTSTTYAGVLADNAGSGGTLALNKIGTNTLTLSGTNTYSYGTTIGAGTLSISSDTNLGAIPGTATAGNVVISGGATLATSTNLTINANRGLAIGPGGATAATLAPAAGTTLTYNGIIANSGTATGGLTKSNTSGTLVLGGANTYVGDTTISGGTLKITTAAAIPSGTGKGNVSVSGTLDLNGNAISINGLTGAGTLTSGVAGAVSISVGGNDAGGTFSGVINNGNGTLSVAKTGAGTIILSGTSTYTGGTTISGGSLSISSDGNLGAVPGTATPANLVINGGTLTTSASMTLNANRGIAVGPAGGSGSGSIAVGSGTTLTYGGIIANNTGGSGGLTKTNTTGNLILSGANTYSGDTTISGGTLQLGNVAAIPSGSGRGNLILASGSTLDLCNFSPTLNGFSGAGTITNSLTGSLTLSVGDNNAAGTYSGVIQDGNGSISLAKIGSGTQTLGGLSTYSGDTTVSNGILQLGISAAIPSGLGKGNLVLNGSLDLAGFFTTINGLSGSGSVTNRSITASTLTVGSNDQTSIFAGNIQNGIGNVALTKVGAGVLTLSGSNTYSGPTTIATGTLAIGSNTGLSPNSTVTINGPSGFLDVNGFNATMDGLLGTGTITNNGASDATLTAGAAGGSSTFSGVIQDGSKVLSLTKSGVGTLTLNGINTYSGTTTISNGTLSVANPGAGGNLGSASSAIVLGDAINKGTLSYSSNADLSYTRGLTVNAGGGEMDITSTGKTLTLMTGGVSTSGTYTLGGAGNAVINSVISGTGGFTKANTGTLLLGSANTYCGDTTISSGTLQLGNLTALPSGTDKGNLLLNATLDVNNLSITVNGLSGAGVLTNSAGSPVTLTVGANNASGNFTGVIQDGSGITSLTKIGGGTLLLGGVNTYSGNTAITGGTLQIGNSYAIASGSNKGNVSLGSGGTLDLNNCNLTLNGLSGSGTITNNSGVAVLTTGANDQSSSFSGNLQNGSSGILGLTKTGVGTLTLSGTNTFSGATTLAGGTLAMGSDTALSSHSTLTVNNAGTLDLNGHLITIDGLAGTGAIINNNSTPVTLTTGASGGGGIFGGTINDGSGKIALTKTGSGTVTLSNVNGYSGGTTVTGGLLAITSTGALGAIPGTATPGNIVLNGGGISATNTFAINANRGITLGSDSGTLDAAQNQTLTYNGILAGAGGLTKTGLGTLSLGGVNTYSGDTLVNAGALQIGSAYAIPSGPNTGNLSLAADTTLDLNNTSITVNGLTGTGLVSNTKTGAVTLSAGANGQTSTFAGVIEDGNGTTSLEKVGTGVLTLTGTNTYSGGTTITGGKLSVANSAALGLESNLLTIGAGATLQTTESFNTSRPTILGGAGNGVGGTFEVGQTLEYTSSSNISGSGSLIKTGAGTLTLSGIDTYTGGTYIKEGTLVSTSSQAPGPQPPAGSNLYAHHIYDGATLQISVGSWSTERQIELVGDTVGGMAAIHITNGYTQQRNGLIYGTGKLDLVGAGTMIVTNANTYAGGTIVENGVLQVNNSSGSATGAGAVTVQNGGILSGLPDAHGSYAGTTGAIAGTVEITGSGTLLARSGGTLTLGGLTLDGGSFSSFQLGAVTSTPAINITGTHLFALPSTGLSTIDIINTGAMASGTYHLFDYTGTAFSADYFGKLALADSHTGLFDLSLVNNTSNTSIDLSVSPISQQWRKGGTDTNWSSEANWWTGVVPNGTGQQALFIDNDHNNGGSFAAHESVTLNTQVTVGTVAFNNSSTAFTLHAINDSTLTLDETGSAAVIQIFSAPNTAGANNVIDAPVILAHDLNIGVAAGSYGLDISGPISGDGKNLTKAGDGPLTLSGAAANTYGGLTEVTAGTLNLNKTAGTNALAAGGLQIDYGATVALLASNQIADGASVAVNGTFALGTFSETIANLSGGGAITTGDGSVLTIAGADNSIFQGVISGSGGIVKAGAGTLTLNGTNSYTGGTAINGGIVQVGADNNLGGTGGIAFDGGTLFFSGSFNSARAITLNSGGGTLDTDGSAATLTGLISGAGTLTKQGLGTVTLGTANTYSGGTVIENGVLQISNNTALGTGGITVKPGGELEFNGYGLSTSNELILAGGEICTLLGINTYTGAITLSADSLIDADSDKLIITSGIGQSGGVFGLTKDGPGVVELKGTNTYTGATHVIEGTLSLFSGAALADTGAVILDNTPGVQLLLNASETIGSLSGGGSGGGNVELGASTLTVGDATSTRFDGIISGSGGSLAKQGSGTLTLGGANTYSGATSINAGVLNIQNATALGSGAGTTTVTSGAAMQMQGNISVSSEALILNGTGINSDGALRNISGTNTYAGLLTLGNVSRINSDAGSLTLSNSGTITGSYALTVGGAGDTSISSNIGCASLTKDGSGCLTLGGANSYTGDTNVTSGTLRMANAQAIPFGSGKGNVSLAATTTLDLHNTGITVNGLSGTGRVTNSLTGAASLTIGDNNQTSTFDGVISDGNGLTTLAKVGTGALTLTGTNSYSGGTTLAAGTLRVSADANLGTAADTPTAGNIVLQAGATLATTESFTLDSNRGIAVSPTGAGSIDVASATTLSYGGTIADNGGGGSFTKTGSGTLVLSGTSNYSGSTTVAAGTLTIEGSLASSASLAVQSGATLTGTGTTGNMTIDASGTLAPGNSAIGTLAVAGNLILNGNANFELGAAGASHASSGVSDRIEVSGGITLGGTLNLTDNADANNQGFAGAGSYKLFTYAGTASGSFSSVNALPAYHTAVHDVADDNAIYVDMYNYAAATVTPAVDLGRVHAGGVFGTQALTVTNTAVSGGFTELLGAAFGTVATGLTATGSLSDLAGQEYGSGNMSVGISDTTAGAKSGTLAVNFTSQAVTGSGLSNTALASQNVSVTGFSYTGQGVWSNTGSGAWGNNQDAYSNWNAAGGVPGLDGSLSAGDTATFGRASSTPATVSLDGASPSLSGITFDNANAYTLAQGSGGELTLMGNGSGTAATITVTSGSHSVAVPVTLASNANVAVTHSNDSLTITGTLAGVDFGITKTGDGSLSLTGSNTYSGATQVNGGSLWINGDQSHATGAVTVASGATLGGIGVLGGATTINSGGIYAAGEMAGAIGKQTFGGSLTYNSGSIFEWDLNGATFGSDASPLGTYDQVEAVAAVSVGNGAIFKIVLSDANFTHTFWDENRKWDNIFTGNGTASINGKLFRFGGSGSSSGLSSDGTVAGRGQFSFNGATLNWITGEGISAIPEPGSLLVLASLLGSGLCLRSRRQR